MGVLGEVLITAGVLVLLFLGWQVWWNSYVLAGQQTAAASAQSEKWLRQGNAPHTHEVEEVFFILQGRCTVFVEDEAGNRLSQELGPWELISCPAGVINGYQNDTDEPCYLQVVLGRGRPEVAGFADDKLFEKREAHLS